MQIINANSTKLYYLTNLLYETAVQNAGMALDEDGNLATLSLLQEHNNSSLATVYTQNNIDGTSTIDLTNATVNYSLGENLVGHAQSMTPVILDMNLITMDPNKKATGKYKWPLNIGLMSATYLDMDTTDTQPNGNVYDENSNIIKFKKLKDISGLNSIRRLEFGIDASSTDYACLVFTNNTDISLVVVSYNTNDMENEDQYLLSSLTAQAEYVSELIATGESVQSSDYLVDATKLHVISKIILPLQNFNEMTKAIAEKNNYSNIEKYNKFSLQGVSMDQYGNIYLSSGFGPEIGDMQQNPVFIVKIPHFGSNALNDVTILDLTENKQMHRDNFFIEPESIQVYDTNKLYLSYAYHEKTGNQSTKQNMLAKLTF